MANLFEFIFRLIFLFLSSSNRKNRTFVYRSWVITYQYVKIISAFDLIE